MHETKILIEWLDAVCEEARDSAKAGDLSKANALAHSGVLKYYFNNVYMLPNMSRATFGAVSTYMEQVDALYVADLKAQETVRKMLESEAARVADGERITKLEEAVLKLTAALEAQKPVKPAKKPKTEPEAEETDEAE